MPTNINNIRASYLFLITLSGILCEQMCCIQSYLCEGNPSSTIVEKSTQPFYNEVDQLGPIGLLYGIYILWAIKVVSSLQEYSLLELSEHFDSVILLLGYIYSKNYKRFFCLIILTVVLLKRLCYRFELLTISPVVGTKSQKEYHLISVAMPLQLSRKRTRARTSTRNNLELHDAATKSIPQADLLLYSLSEEIHCRLVPACLLDYTWGSMLHMENSY